MSTSASQRNPSPSFSIIFFPSHFTVPHPPTLTYPPFPTLRTPLTNILRFIITPISSPFLRIHVSFTTLLLLTYVRKSAYSSPNAYIFSSPTSQISPFMATSPLTSQKADELTVILRWKRMCSTPQIPPSPYTHETPSQISLPSPNTYESASEKPQIPSSLSFTARR